MPDNSLERAAKAEDSGDGGSIERKGKVNGSRLYNVETVSSKLKRMEKLAFLGKEVKIIPKGKKKKKI